MRGLLETGIEMPRNGFDVVSLVFGRLRELRIRHKNCGSEIPGQSTMREVTRVVRRQALRFDRFSNFVIDFQICELLGNLKILACSVETVVEQYLSAMPVKSTNRSHHNVRRQASHVETM